MLLKVPNIRQSSVSQPLRAHRDEIFMQWIRLRCIVFSWIVLPISNSRQPAHDHFPRLRKFSGNGCGFLDTNIQLEFCKRGNGLRSLHSGYDRSRNAAHLSELRRDYRQSIDRHFFDIARQCFSQWTYLPLEHDEFHRLDRGHCGFCRALFSNTCGCGCGNSIDNYYRNAATSRCRESSNN